MMTEPVELKHFRSALGTDVARRRVASARQGVLKAIPAHVLITLLVALAPYLINLVRIVQEYINSKALDGDDLADHELTYRVSRASLVGSDEADALHSLKESLET